MASFEPVISATEARFYEALGELTARKAKEDLYFLCTWILGADRIKARRNKFDHHHKKLCDDLMMMVRKRYDGSKQGYVVQWPRGTMKSTIVDVGLPIWILLNDPNARILIDCENATKALAYQKVIRSYFESPLFKELFGVLFDPRKDWNDERLTVLRSADGLKEPSIDVGGADKDKTGYHYDFILSDDVVGETNSKTVEQIQKTIAHVGQYTPLLDSDGLVVFSMTRWAFGDLGEWIEQENESAFRDVRPYPYIINRLPAFKEKSVGDYTDELEFPLLHTRATLMHALNQLKPYQFSCQYLLRPQSPQAAAFQHKWIKWIGTDCDDIPYGVVPHGANCYITVDPASSDKRGSDFTAIIVAAIKPDFTIYILDVIRKHLTAKEIYDQLDVLTQVYRPLKIGMESVFKLKEIFLEVKMQAQLNGKVLPIEPFKTTQTNKGHRIMGLQPMMQGGRFYMRRRVGDFVYLEDEIVKFDPKRIDSQKNDCLDAAAYLLEMLNKPDEVAPLDPFTAENWKERMEEDNKQRAKMGLPIQAVPSQGFVRMKKWHTEKAKHKNDEFQPLSRVMMR